MIAALDVCKVGIEVLGDESCPKCVQSLHGGTL